MCFSSTENLLALGPAQVLESTHNPVCVDSSMESKLIPLTWHLQASVLPVPTSSQSRSIPPASKAKNSSSFLSAVRPHSSPNHPQILLQSGKPQPCRVSTAVAFIPNSI